MESVLEQLHEKVLKMRRNVIPVDDLVDGAHCLNAHVWALGFLLMEFPRCVCEQMQLLRRTIYKPYRIFFFEVHLSFVTRHEKKTL